MSYWGPKEPAGHRTLVLKPNWVPSQNSWRLYLVSSFGAYPAVSPSGWWRPVCHVLGFKTAHFSVHISWTGQSTANMSSIPGSGRNMATRHGVGTGYFPLSDFKRLPRWLKDSHCWHEHIFCRERCWTPGWHTHTFPAHAAGATPLFMKLRRSWIRAEKLRWAWLSN